DMATYPSFEEAPGIGINYDLHVIGVTNISKNKEESFKVVETLVSTDVQRELSINGRLPVLDDPDIRNEFGKRLAYLNGKNVQAIFKTTPANNTPKTPYDSIARDDINGVTARHIFAENIDINTALRESEERIMARISELTGK